MMMWPSAQAKSYKVAFTTWIFHFSGPCTKKVKHPCLSPFL